jgi:glycosyltransferase involved in cell wall biosynthesis
MKTVLCIATAGKGTLDELRMRRLASKLNAQVTYYYVDRSVSRLVAAKEVWRLLKASKWDLVYQEGTGIAGGLSLIRAALTWKQPFVVSGGDPIAGFFRTTKGPLIGNLFELYERSLYQTCAGFIGWTPYLTGVAMRMGAKRAVTVEGGVDMSIFYPYTPTQRLAVRQKYGIHPDHLVCGVVGSLIWVPPQAYCYGYELIETLKRIKRKDVSFLIVGDGDGKSRMEQALPEDLRSRVVFTGRLPETQVVDVINAMDIGFVTLFSELGNYRLTTKLPEYLACGVPVAMSPTAGFYDYAASAGWALPRYHPASSEFHEHCAQWLDQLSWSDVAEKAKQAPEVAHQYFDYNIVGAKFSSFVHELLYSSKASDSLSTVSQPGQEFYSSARIK